MEKIKVLIVEDELIVSETIKEILVSYGYQVIGQADSSDAAMDIINQQMPDIVLMDIQIKGKHDGIALAEQILKMYAVGIIFITAYYEKNFLDRARNIRPSAYIVKPFKEQDIFVAIELAVDALVEKKKQKSVPLFFFKSGGIFYRIPAETILYLEADGSYTRVHLSASTLLISENLKTTLQKLPEDHFVRIHRSYVVNKASIQKFTSHSVFIGSVELTISQSYRDSFLKAIQTL